jgi:hypothetical protein
VFDDLQYLLIASGYVGIFLWASSKVRSAWCSGNHSPTRDIFSYKWVAVTAFMGGFFGDQFYF